MCNFRIAWRNMMGCSINIMLIPFDLWYDIVENFLCKICLFKTILHYFYYFMELNIVHMYIYIIYIYACLSKSGWIPSMMETKIHIRLQYIPWNMLMILFCFDLYTISFQWICVIYLPLSFRVASLAQVDHITAMISVKWSWRNRLNQTRYFPYSYSHNPKLHTTMFMRV